MSADGQKFTLNKVIKLFNADLHRNTLIKAEQRGAIPEANRSSTASTKRRTWSLEDLPAIGERYGFLKKIDAPVCAAIFATKGGILKTSLAMNLARLTALHNIRTCIVGLDMQADITNAFGLGVVDEDIDVESLEDLDITQLPGLLDFKRGKATLDQCVVPTEIPTLFIIPESSELVGLDAHLNTETRREYWLKENIIEPLKERFDLIIIDCPPNWNQLVSNALIASDLLISPVECKINHYRNIKDFIDFVSEFKSKAKASFEHIFVPTKYNSTRKLSSEIRKWYNANLPNCILTAVRESTVGEEASAASLSVPEYAPSKPPSDEMKEVVSEIWRYAESVAKKNRPLTYTRERELAV
jgi:chromosome partitioning protein